MGQVRGGRRGAAEIGLSRSFRAGAGLAGAILLVAASPAPAAAPALHFVDVADQAGLATATWCGRQEKPHILESGGTGLALFDYDGDGDLDLYLVNGWRLEGPEVVERGRNALYRNRGDGIFQEVTEQAGVGDEGWGAGTAVGDLDGDGLDDLLVTNFGPDVLYRNRGDGSFVPTGFSGIDGWSAGAAIFDADGDGDHDLYIGAYIDSTLEEVLHARPTLDWEGMKVMLGPFGLEGKGNRYYENVGGGELRDRTEEAGLEDVGLFYTFAVAALDLDGDLDLDLYAANDSNPNYLYRNNGKGQFQEVGLWSGAALDQGGNAQAGMGLAAADLDHDGLVDLLVTNFYKDVSTLYRNLGDFVFEDVTRPLGLERSTFMPLSWGTVFADLDLDGDLDLFIANGHIYPQADRAAGTAYRQPNLLLRNEGGRFEEVGGGAGPGLAVEESSRGLAAGDLDGDGDLDLVVANCDAPATLLRNDSARGGAWLVVDAPSALRVRVEAGGRTWIGHRVEGGSYVSVSDRRFHFGLGRVPQVERLTLEEPDGRRTRFEWVPADRTLVVAQRSPV